jgi:hypothetical protein
MIFFDFSHTGLRWDDSQIGNPILYGGFASIPPIWLRAQV